ncbi:MAG: methionyl-tRNA formyltransferase [Bacilli bacterium]|nr:methionyl-tRNA formyltransferase [Bacilli bacterium]
MRIVFMGTPEFAVNVLDALINSPYEVVGVVTQPDKPVGRKQILTPPPVKVLAEKHHLPVFQPVKIKTDYDQILAWQPDIIITCAYGQIIPKVLLDTPPYKAINVHASLLPKYRGGAPIHKAIIDGEEKTGITTMYMSEKMDEGDIIAQREIKILEDDDVESLHDKLSKLGAELLLETLPLIFSNKITPIKQNPEEATYAYNIKPEDEIIKWDKTGKVVYNHIRGLSPFPGAYTILDGKRIKVFKASKIETNKLGLPGEIIEVMKDGIIVKTSDNTSIKLQEVQLEGKTRQNFKDILNGKHPFEIGKRFTLE